MGFLSGLVTYILIWWVVIFAVLPWGNRAPATPEKGHVGSAPENPNLKKKFIATTLISAFIWGIVFVLIEIEIIDLRTLQRSLSNPQGE